MALVETRMQQGTPSPRSRKPNQALLPQKSQRNRNRFGEMAGGTAAECAAVCCCPCALLNLTVLVFIKLPIGLAKKAISKRKRKVASEPKFAICNDHDYDLSLDDPSVSVKELLPSKTTTFYVNPEEFWDDVTGGSARLSSARSKNPFSYESAAKPRTAGCR